MTSAATELFSGLPLVFEKSSASNPADNPYREWELESVVALALLMVSQVDRLRATWFPADREDPSGFDWDRAKQVAGLYTQWLSAVEPIIAKMRLPESPIAKLNGSEELKARYSDVKLMSLDIDRVRESIESLEQGRGIPFDIAMEELRNNLR
jgi:hypothetical protein